MLLSAGTTSQPWMNTFDASRTAPDHKHLDRRGGAQFAEAYGEELEVLGPLNVGRGYRFSFSYSVTDIDILADLTA
jgi:hypothetical protein